MARDPDEDLAPDPDAFATAVDPILPSKSSLDGEVTPREPFGSAPNAGLDQTPLDVMEQTPVDPFDETPQDPPARIFTDPDTTDPELLGRQAPSLDSTPLRELESEETVKEEPLFTQGEPASSLAGPRDTDEDPPFSQGPVEAEIDITAPTVTGGESHLDTPVGIRIENEKVLVDRGEGTLERTEIVGRLAGSPQSHDSLGDTVVTRPAKNAGGWIVAFAVLVVAAVAVGGLYYGVVRPLQVENDTLREQIDVAEARELELRGRLENVSATKSQLEAATESLNRQVEEQEGELDAAARDEEEEDAARRREEESKAGEKKKAKKKRKKRRR